MHTHWHCIHWRFGYAYATMKTMMLCVEYGIVFNIVIIIWISAIQCISGTKHVNCNVVVLCLDHGEWPYPHILYNGDGRRDVQTSHSGNPFENTCKQQATEIFQSVKTSKTLRDRVLCLLKKRSDENAKELRAWVQIVVHCYLGYTVLQSKCKYRSKEWSVYLFYAIFLL